MTAPVLSLAALMSDLVLRYAPRGAVGTTGYALCLLAAFTSATGMAVEKGQLTVADCSGPMLNDVLQVVAVGQAFSAALVIAIGIGLQWQNVQQDKTEPVTS